MAARALSCIVLLVLLVYVSVTAPVLAATSTDTGSGSGSDVVVTASSDSSGSNVNSGSDVSSGSNVNSGSDVGSSSGSDEGSPSSDNGERNLSSGEADTNVGSDAVGSVGEAVAMNGKEGGDEGGSTSQQPSTDSKPAATSSSNGGALTDGGSTATTAPPSKQPAPTPPADAPSKPVVDTAAVAAAIAEERQGNANDGDTGSAAGSTADSQGSGLSLRRQQTYRPNGWRGAPSKDPDDVFRASYQPSHILTFAVKSGSKELLYAEIESGAVVRGDFFVIRGSVLQVDFEVSAPSGKTMFYKPDAMSGIFMFTAKETGTYTIQVTSKGTFGSKTVSVAWLVGADADDAIDMLSLAQKRDVEPLSMLTHSIHSKLDGVVAALAYQDVRFKRGVQLEESTSSRIAWSTLLETVVLFAVTGLQIVYIRRIVDKAVGWV